MATITKRGEYSWRVQVRRRGMPSLYKTFNYREDAEKWARQIEAELDRGLFMDRRDAERTTFAELASRFAEDYAPHHYRSTGWKFKLQHLCTHFGPYALSAITPKLVTSYRDARLKQPDPRFKTTVEAVPTISPGTVKMELDLLSKVLDVATKEFDIALPNGNPVARIRKPKDSSKRERRLSPEEEQRLFETCRDYRNSWLLPAGKLAVETGMRQGELLALEWRHVNLPRRVAFLPMTKNGEARAIPLSPAAVEVLEALPRDIQGLVLPIGKMTLYKAFQMACQRADVQDFTFHDLRHEALSRLAERGDFSVLELAAVSGHKTLQVLKRYTHLQAEKLAEKMATIRTAHAGLPNGYSDARERVG